MTYLRSTQPIAHKAKPHQMHTNDSTAAAVARGIKTGWLSLPKWLHAITLGFCDKAMATSLEHGGKKGKKGWTHNKNKIIAPVIILIFLTQCHIEKLAMLRGEWGMSLGLFFCCCVNWISALPVPPWQGSDWINGVESTAAWQGDRLLAQLGSSMGAPRPAGSPGRPQTS